MRIREVVVTGQRQVELQEREVDLSPGPGQVLIETEKTFISAGTELANYMARDAGVFRPGNWCAYPWRSGYGNVGIVREAGAGVKRAKVGQRVLSYGNHASFVRYDAESNLVFPVPEGLDSGVAASSRMAGVAMTSIILAEIKGAPWVVVFGLGAVGNLAAQGFALRGCRVIGVDPVPERRALAERCGLSHTAGGTADEVRARVKEITGGAMAGITVDAVGHSDVIREALAVTAPFGQHVILGSPRVPVEGNLTAAFADIHVRFLTVRGALEWCLPIYPGPTPGMSQFEKQDMIFEWLARGSLKLNPLISHRLRPEKIKDAYEGLECDKATFTGVVLDWPGG
ncbi:MAG: zinc-binding alcohol dehydrogenase [Candidatus Coatesbacteria bacterium]